MAERRSNTLSEKRKMRNERKKRKRSKSKALEAHLQLEQTLRSEAQQKVVLYKNMSRSYCERWQWELEQRKECMVRERGLLARVGSAKAAEVKLKVHEIDPNSLQNPLADTSDKATDIFVRRGSFGVVRLQNYRRMTVAVKELLPRTLAADVYKEVMMLVRFCHPYLPRLFEVITSQLPYSIFMQYHGLL